MPEDTLDSDLVKLPLVKAEPLAKAPRFEIQLFRSKLSFSNPKASAKVAKDLAGRKVDARPFLNTALKAEYDCNEELGRCITNIFFSAWKIYPNKFLASSIGSVNLYLNGLGVTRGDRIVYRDLHNTDTAKVWLKNLYSCQPSDLASPAQESAPKNTDIAVSFEKISENAVYTVKPRSNQIDFFVPFSAADLLQFSFQFSAKNKKVRADLGECMQSVENFARDILESISLSQQLPDKAS